MKYKAGDKVLVPVFLNNDYCLTDENSHKYIIPDGDSHSGTESSYVKSIECEVIQPEVRFGQLNYLLKLDDHSDVVGWDPDFYSEYRNKGHKKVWWVPERFILEVVSSEKEESGANCKNCNYYNEYVVKSDSYICFNCR